MSTFNELIGGFCVRPHVWVVCCEFAVHHLLKHLADCCASC